LLDSSVRAPRIRGLRGYVGRTGKAFALWGTPQDRRTRRAVDPAVALLRPLTWVVPASGLRVGAACLFPATADAGASRRRSCPTHAENLGADERQTDGSLERHHGTDGHIDHRRHSARRTRSQKAGQTAARAL